MSSDRNDSLYNRFGRERISSRQIDELIGLARGLCADGILNDRELEFLLKWLAANADISEEPVITTLYQRVDDILRDGIVDEEEREQLFEALNGFSDTTFELGEVLKPVSLPICSPPPSLSFDNTYYCFTGTFSFGKRRECEQAVIKRGAVAGSLTQKTNYLVIGSYATESWKHSSYGAKIEKACEMRDQGIPISIVPEDHWIKFL